MSSIDRAAERAARSAAAGTVRLEGPAGQESLVRPVRPVRPELRLRRVAVAATVASAALAGVGVAWVLAPELSPLDDGMRSLGSALLGGEVVAALAVALGLIGVLLGAALLLRSRRRRLPVGGAAAALALVIALTLGSTSTVAIAGYLFGLAAVVAGLTTIGVMLVRAPRSGWALLAGLIGVTAVAFWWAGLTFAGVAEFAVAFAGALAEDVGLFGATGVVLAATLAWAAIAVEALRTSGSSASIESWLVAHRRSITVLAALGPIPYAVARASWLTPWPLFAPDVAELEPAVLATGLMLGSGGIAASLLTLGLILPWGRRFPHWFPRLGGRSVPVAAAAIPGSAAAGVLCISAGPMLVHSFTSPGSPIDAITLNLVLPLWFWGPMLALAVWAYVAWRARDVEPAAHHPRAR